MRKAKLGIDNIERDVERIRTLLAGKSMAPLYDSGWELSAAGGHTFTHNLGALPALVSLMAADDSSGTNPVLMLMGRNEVGVNLYGFRETILTTTQMGVYLQASGYAYSASAGKYYIVGTDYVRLLVWATIAS